MSDEKGVTENSPTPSALETAIASTPEVTEAVEQKAEEAQTPTAEQGTPEPEEQQEEGRIPYSRFKEKVDEANWYKTQLEQRLNQPTQQPIQQPTTNQYASMTPEEERFWRAVDDRAGKIADDKLRQITPVIEAGRMELAQSKVFQFRQSHPDIRPNSPEEMEIAQRISSGYLPDDAYWSIMGPRGIRVAEEKGKQQAKQQLEAKKKANVEARTSVNATTVVPTKKETFRQTAARLLDLADKGQL